MYKTQAVLHQEMIVATEFTQRKLLAWALASLAGLLVTHEIYGQDITFKLGLFKRGVQQLRMQTKTNVSDIENAMEAAFAIDPERLSKELVSANEVAKSAAFRASVKASYLLADSDLALRYIPQENLKLKDAESFARLSFAMGTRREALSLLLQSSKEFLTTRDINIEFELEEGRAEEKSDAKIREQRTQFLQFHHHLGRIQNHDTLESQEYFQRGISSPKLKNFIRAVWLTRVGAKVLTGAELLKEIKEIKPKGLALRVLNESLQGYDQAQLKSMVADVLILQLIQLYFDSQSESEECDLFLDKVDGYSVGIDSMKRMFRRSATPSQIIALAKKTQSLKNELKILEQLEVANSKKKLEPELWQNWGQALVNSSLQSGKLADAKTIATRFSLTVPSGAVLKMAILQGKIAMAKRIVDSSDNFSRRDTSLLAAALLQAGRNDEAKTYLDQLKDDFKRQLENQPDHKKATWLVDFVMQSGWSMRDVPMSQLPLEQTVFDAFKPLANSTQINDTIAKSLGSFTPPTPASRRLLLKMMKTLPESQQIVSLFEIKQLAEKVRVAPKADHAELRKEAIRMISKALNYQKNEYASRLAFSFALVGDKDGVNQLIEQITAAESKTWALFQCSKVFPPRRDLIQKYEYSRRRLGGGLF